MNMRKVGYFCKEGKLFAVPNDYPDGGT